MKICNLRVYLEMMSDLDKWKSLIVEMNKEFLKDFSAQYWDIHGLMLEPYEYPKRLQWREWSCDYDSCIMCGNFIGSFRKGKPRWPKPDIPLPRLFWYSDGSDD